jgi:two-component system, cell cycle response regulator
VALISYQSSLPPVSASRPQRVLILSDDDSAAEALLRLCEHEGCEARRASTPAPVANDEPELAVVALSDLVAARELCGDMRQAEGFRDVGLLVVCLSTPCSEDAAACLLAGADDYCSLLPVHRVELRARLRVHLRNKRHRDAVIRLRSERNRLRVRVSTDSLTGTLTRGMLIQSIDQCLDLAAPFAVMFVDVDHFKDVNDTFGHDVGDRVLRQVATTLARACRAQDACGRYGGEEFVIVLTDVSPEQAMKAAERHRLAIGRLRFGDWGPLRVTISVGLATADPSCLDPTSASILQRADAALYQAKGQGRNRTVVAEAFCLKPVNEDADPSATPPQAYKVQHGSIEPRSDTGCR